jgi:hypothetical protein
LAGKCGRASWSSGIGASAASARWTTAGPGPAVKSASWGADIGDALTDRAGHQKCVGGSGLAERTLCLTLIRGGRFNFRLGLGFLLFGLARLTGARLTNVGIAI